MESSLFIRCACLPTICILPPLASSVIVNLLPATVISGGAPALVVSMSTKTRLSPSCIIISPWLMRRSPLFTYMPSSSFVIKIIPGSPPPGVPSPSGIFTLCILILCSLAAFVPSITLMVPSKIEKVPFCDMASAEPGKSSALPLRVRPSSFATIKAPVSLCIRAMRLP